MASCERSSLVKCLIYGAIGNKMQTICTEPKRKHLKQSGIPRLKTARKMSREPSRCGKTTWIMPDSGARGARDWFGKLTQTSWLKRSRSGWTSVWQWISKCATISWRGLLPKTSSKESHFARSGITWMRCDGSDWTDCELMWRRGARPTSTRGSWCMPARQYWALRKIAIAHFWKCALMRCGSAKKKRSLWWCRRLSSRIAIRPSSQSASRLSKKRSRPCALGAVVAVKQSRTWSTGGSPSISTNGRVWKTGNPSWSIKTWRTW